MPDPEAQDDLVHEPRDDPRWRESYYFSFFDWNLGIGGFSSIGKRPAKGHAGSINVLWGTSMPTLIASEYDSFSEHTDDHVVAGLSYRGTAPFGPWELKFDGTLNDGGTDVECDHDALAPSGRSPAPNKSTRFDLTFTPLYPPYLYVERDEWRELFDGHIDEVGAVEGELEIDGQTHRIQGRGAKDHSWGVRDWFKPAAWRWIDVLAEDGPELALWRARFNGGWVEDGALYGPGGVEGLSEYEETVETTDRPRKPLPARIGLRAAAGSQELGVEGEVVRVVPIFFGRDLDGGRQVSWNDRALVRCRTDGGATAWANVEFETLLAE
jgi:hypothetical protein